MPELIAGNLSTEEQKIIDLAGTLLDAGNLHPLIALLQGGKDGPECARDALRVVGEFDVGVLVQLVLDHLIDAYVPAGQTGWRVD